jgi:serine protease Do
MNLAAPLRLPLLLLIASGVLAVGMNLGDRNPPLPLPRETPESAEAVVPDAVDRVAPAVVSVYSTRAAGRTTSSLDPLGIADSSTRTEQGLGSGVIARADGVIVTNHHVVDGATELRVVLADRREFRGRVLGSDPQTDVALVRIGADGLPVAAFGDSSRVRVGEKVLAIGNSLGIGQTVSSGIVSAKGRANIGILDDEDFLQTDAAINPGNSGGPLVNLKGEVIGINTAIATRTGGFQGVGFAIPSLLVTEITDILLRDGRVTRGRIGLALQDLTPPLARAFKDGPERGAIVTDAPEKGAAREAGIRRGDIIVKFEGRPVESSAELRHRIAIRGAGARVKLEIWRNRKTIEIVVRLQEAEGSSPGHAKADDAGDHEPVGASSGIVGVGVGAVSPDTLHRAGVDEEGGVIVISVLPSSLSGGLRRGDLIVEVDLKPVHSSSELREAVRRSGDPVLLRVRRADTCVYLSVSK